MLRQVSRLQGHLLRTAKQSYFPAEGNAFNQRDIWYHFSDQSTFDLSSNLQTSESCQYETTTQKYLTLDPSSFSPPKSIQINPILYCQKCVFSPLFHSLTYASTRGYSSLQDPLQDQESNQQRELDEIKDIIEMLCDKEKIDKLYDEDGNLMKEGALARKLFQDGISPEELTSLNPQKRFTDAINKQGNLVFYPTEVTVDIFKRILLSKNGLYLSSQNGVGKSFSVALFTFLMRKKPNTRVLYLNNPTTLLGNWTTLRIELEIAFREELQDSNLQQELKSIFDLKKVDEVIHCLGLFFNNLCEALKHKNIQLFIIIDQVNILDNLEGAKNEGDANVFRFYRLFRFFPYANATRVLVSSATNEAMIDQEFPEFTIYPSNVCENTAKKVIADRFNINIKLKEVEDVYALSGGYFLIIQELAVLPLGPRWEKNLKIYKRIKTLQIKDDLERFMSKKDVRKRAMAAVYRALVSEESESNLPTDLFSNDKIDRRHIIYNVGEGKIAPLHPLVLEALKRLFLDSDVLKEMIYLFSNNPVMCGFLFERLMLSQFEHGQTSLSGRSLQKPDQDIVEIISASSRIHSIVDKQKLNFAMQGFYKPDSSSFPAFDCFISTRDNLYAIQVTKKITKERLTRLITAFQILSRDSPSIKDMKKDGKKKAGKDQDQTQNKKKNSSREEILEFKNDEKIDPIKVKITKRFLDIVRQVEMQAKVQKKQLKIVVLSLSKKSDQKKFLDYFAKAKIETEFLITDAQPVMIEMGFDQEYIQKLSFSFEHLVHEEHEE